MSLYGFFTAIRLGNVQGVLTHLESEKFTVETQNDLGFTGFLFACTYGQQEVVDLLLEKGANISHQDNDGWTCLHKAAFCSHTDLFKHLLEKGADASLTNCDAKMGHQMCRNEEVTKTLEEYVKTIVGEVTPKPAYQKKVEKIVEKKQENSEEPNPSLEVKEKVQESTVNIPVGKSGNTMILFPGQGAQKVGMVTKHLDSVGTKELFEEAKEILGYDILDICQNGPAEKLNDTLVSQPAIYLTSLAALFTLQQKNADALANAGHTAGFSLGEYTALVFAGVMDWRDGLRLIKTRAEAMQKAAGEADSGMVSLVGLDDPAVESLCSSCDVQVANYLFPKGRVISGGAQELEKAISSAKAKGAQRAIKLKVSGAFHSKYMASAQSELDQALQEIRLNAPQCQVYANINAKAYQDGEAVRTGLAEQLTGSVRWEETMRQVEATQFFEVGPGNQLRSMMRRIDMAKWKATKNI